MTLDRVLACAAPLIFSDSDGENPFFGGTCFRASFRGRPYVITARHCVEGRGLNLSEARVECAASEQTYLPLKTWHLVDTHLVDGAPHGDIAIFEVDSDRVKRADLARIPFLDLEAFPLPGGFRPGWRLLVEGYASSVQEMDYAARRWLRPSSKLEARYEGHAEYQGVSKLSFLDSEKAAAPDGFSGAPVFAIDQLDSCAIMMGFAGMIVLANYFVRSDAIMRAIQRVNADT